MKNQKIGLGLIALVMIGILGTFTFNAKVTRAAESKVMPFSGVVEAVTQKFNLDQTQVQTVVDEYTKKQQSEMEENRLNKLVTDGKITTDQKQKIVEKRAEIKAWAESTGINSSYLMMGMGGRGLGGPPSN